MGSLLKVLVGAAFGFTLGFSIFYLGSRFEIRTQLVGPERLPVYVKWDRWTGESWTAIGPRGTWRHIEDFTPPPLDSEEKPTSQPLGRHLAVTP